MLLGIAVEMGLLLGIWVEERATEVLGLCGGEPVASGRTACSEALGEWEFLEEGGAEAMAACVPDDEAVGDGEGRVGTFTRHTASDMGR